MKYFACAATDPSFVESCEHIVATLPSEMPSFGAREYFARKPETLTECDYLAAAVDPATGNCVGVISVRFLEQNSDVLFVETILISERFHSSKVFSGIVGQVVEALFRDGRGLGRCVAFKTCNPRSYCALRSFGRRFEGLVYPAIGQEVTLSEQRALQVRALRAAVASEVSPGQDFDQDQGIVLNGSGPIADSFYHEFPTSGDKDVDEFFRERVGLMHRLLVTLHLGSKA